LTCTFFTPEHVDANYLETNYKTSKIEAIAQRNTKRDFIDLYFLARQAGIVAEDAMNDHKSKYEGLAINMSHLALSLGYSRRLTKSLCPKCL